jgi:hypothetical protein
MVAFVTPPPWEAGWTAVFAGASAIAACVAAFELGAAGDAPVIGIAERTRTPIRAEIAQNVVRRARSRAVGPAMRGMRDSRS